MGYQPAGGTDGDPWTTSQQHAATPAPPAQPQQAQQAPAAPAGNSGQTPAETAKQLINIGLPDDQIAAATGLDPTVIQAIRANAA